MKFISINIDKLLKEKNISKRKLYELTNISRTNINHIANGQTTSIKFETIIKLCEVLNCTIDELITIEEK